MHIRSEYSKGNPRCWKRCQVLTLDRFCIYIPCIPYICLHIKGTLGNSKYALLFHWVLMECRNIHKIYIDTKLWGIQIGLLSKFLAKRGTEKLALLQEQWESCQGKWSESQFLFQLKESSRTRKRGCRSWMTRAQVASKYGDDWDLANQICDDKMEDPHGEGKIWKKNPDAPLNAVAWLMYMFPGYSGCFKLVNYGVDHTGENPCTSSSFFSTCRGSDVVPVLGQRRRRRRA